MAKTLTTVVSVVLVLLGVIGFFSDPILGMFETDTIHNIIYIVAGVIGFMFASKGEAQARQIALVIGIVYALVTVLGFLAGDGAILGFIANNGAHNWLHLVIAVVLLIVGLKKSSSGGMASPAM